MKQALKQAEMAYDEDEIPVGAVVVIKNQIISKAYNSVEKLKDVTAHAEMLALTAAFNNLGSKYLNHCKLYVTLEPCMMCAGAIFWSQLGELVYGTADEKAGFTRINPRFLYPRLTIKSGILKEECSNMLKEFFREKR